MRAGLIPLVASQFAQGCFRALVLTPDRDPFSSLRAALQSVGIAQNRLTELDARTSDAVKSVLTETRPLMSGGCWSSISSKRFSRCVRMRSIVSRSFQDSRSLRRPHSRIKIVAAMRADFFDRFGPYPTFRRSHSRACNWCWTWKQASCEPRSNSPQPSTQWFEDGLVRQIIADVKGRPGALPLLQYTLDLLWRSDNPVDDRTLNITSYHKLGGSRALRQRADAIYRVPIRRGKTPRSKKKNRS